MSPSDGASREVATRASTPAEGPACPLVVVGGGPAGIAAATEAARAGLSCLLLDEAPRLGGQIHRSLPREFSVLEPRALGKEHGRGALLRTELESVGERVEVRSGTTVLGVWGRELLCATDDDESWEQKAERIVFATGARDRPVPFPGWTLPGVLTAGGAQVLLKTMRVRPGRRALVAGTGPLLLVVANQLHAAGVEVVAVLEAGRPAFTFGALRRVWREWGLLKDAWTYWRGLRKAGIPLLFHHTVFAASGAEGVERATYGPVDPDTWSPLRDRAVTVDVDVLVVGFGFVPNTELTELSGCEHHWQDELGGWVPTRDSCLRTTATGVFAAGDGAGVAGSLVAIEEGRVAGITAAEDAGVLSSGEADRRRARPLKRLRSLGRARSVLDEVSRVRPGLNGLATPETLVCRCEEVALSGIFTALQEGARDLQAVKLLTRLGMGPCQGRNCDPSARSLICAATGLSPAAVGRVQPRPPIKPVTFGTLARPATAPAARRAGEST